MLATISGYEFSQTSVDAYCINGEVFASLDQYFDLDVEEVGDQAVCMVTARSQSGRLASLTFVTPIERYVQEELGAFDNFPEKIEIQ